MLQFTKTEYWLVYPGLNWVMRMVYILLLAAFCVYAGITAELIAVVTGHGDEGIGVVVSLFLAIGIFCHYLFLVKIVGSEGSWRETVLWDPGKKAIAFRPKSTIWVTPWMPFMRGLEIEKYEDLVKPVTALSMIISKDATVIYSVHPEDEVLLICNLPSSYEVVSYASVAASRYINRSGVFDGKHQSFQLKALISTVKSPEVARRMRMALGGNVKDGLESWLHRELQSINCTSLPTCSYVLAVLQDESEKRWDGDVLVESVEVRGPF